MAHSPLYGHNIASRCDQSTRIEVAEVMKAKTLDPGTIEGLPPPMSHCVLMGRVIPNPSE